MAPAPTVARVVWCDSDQVKAPAKRRAGGLDSAGAPPDSVSALPETFSAMALKLANKPASAAAPASSLEYSKEVGKPSKALSSSSSDALADVAEIAFLAEAFMAIA